MDPFFSLYKISDPNLCPWPLFERFFFLARHVVDLIVADIINDCRDPKQSGQKL